MKIADMIKGAVLGCAVCASALIASADSLMFDNPDNKAYFGARVALDISSAANGGDFYSNKTGFAVGAIYNIPIKANFYFEPGLSLFYDVFGTMILKMDYPSSAPGSTIEPGSPDDLEGARMYQIDGTIRNLGFRVPLNFGYHFDFGEDLGVHRPADQRELLCPLLPEPHLHAVQRRDKVVVALGVRHRRFQAFRRTVEHRRRP